MKIKRYFAPDLRQAIRQVREEQGPDAVILSNRRVEDGVELVAAVDYDESLIAGAWQGGTASSARAHDTPHSDEPDVETAHPRGHAAPDETPSVRPAADPRDASRVREPALAEMQQEIKELRGLLENQLSHLTWGDLARTQPLRAALLRRLTQLGLAPELSRELADELNEPRDQEHAWRQALGVLAHRLPVTDDDILTHGGVVALVGPTGVGKTTTVAKLAARFALRYGQRHVALVTTDGFRIGAQEQLLTFGRILGVPVQVATERAELQATLASLHDKKLVLIDTAGMSQRDLRLSEQFATLNVGATLVKSYLVLSANTQMTGLDEAVRAFQRISLDGCILTKLDECVSLGGALSVIVRHRLPIAYVSDGQRVPEDMHPARAHSLVSRAVARAQFNGQAPEEEDMALAFGAVATHACG